MLSSVVIYYYLGPSGAVTAGAVLTHNQVLHDSAWEFVGKIISRQFFEVGDVDPAYFDYVEDEEIPGRREG
jgi:sorbitol-specific phosphotransferase system component IIA